MKNKHAHHIILRWWQYEDGKPVFYIWCSECGVLRFDALPEIPIDGGE